MTFPTDLLYTSDHEWLRIDGETATVGITAYATDSLGDVVFVDLAEAGTTLTAGESCGEIESTKSVSDLFAPADGEVSKGNDAVVADVGLVNSDPYGQGWLFKMTVATLPDLLDAAAYQALTSEGA